MSSDTKPEAEPVLNRESALKRIRSMAKSLPAGWKFNWDEANNR